MKDDNAKFNSLNAPLNPSKWKTRASVIDRFQHNQGTVEDQEYFFHKYRSLVIAIGRNKNLPDEDIKELLSRVFLTVFNEFAKISSGEKKEFIFGIQPDGRNYHFRAWLTRIIQNKINDIYREKGRRKIDESADAVEEADKQFDDSDQDINTLWYKFLLRESLQELRKDLKPSQFQIFYQVKVKGKKGPQVAAVYKQTPDNVNQICSRSMKTLRAIVESLKNRHPIEKYTDDELCRYIDEADKEFQKLEEEFAEEQA